MTVSVWVGGRRLRGRRPIALAGVATVVGLLHWSETIRRIDQQSEEVSGSDIRIRLRRIRVLLWRITGRTGVGRIVRHVERMAVSA